MATKFKVGDKVRSKQADESYTGTVVTIGTRVLYVQRDDMNLSSFGDMWYCKILDDGRVATADGVWDGHSYLELDVSEPSILWSGMDYGTSLIGSGGCFAQCICDEEIIKTKKTIMENIVEFAKNLVLSADEKLLREQGLKDSRGDYTREAERIVLEKVIKENEAYLIEIAKAKKEADSE